MAADWDQPLPVAGHDTDDRSWVRRHPLVVAAVAAVAIAGVVFVAGGDSRPEERGEQLGSPTARVQGPGTKFWIELIPADGVPRDGWPPPMIARDFEVCFGFGRVDFGPPTRPTLARCVQVGEIPELPANGLSSLVVIEAGNDTWHLLATGGAVDSVRAVDAFGSDVELGRIHVDDDLIALRLPSSLGLSELSWIVGRARIRCAPPPDATTTGRFCAAE